MTDLIVLLECIKQSARDAHYRSAGPCFYGQHLLADVISEPIDGFIDRIKEVCFLGKELNAHLSTQVVAEVSERLNDKPLELEGYVKLTIYTIEDKSKRGVLMQGELNILGEISEHLMKSKGLLWRQSLGEVGSDE